MIPYIDTQLSIWGKWTARNASKGLGFPSVCPMFQDVQHGGAFGSGTPPGIEFSSREEVQTTDEAVKRLSQDQRRLCIEYYVIRGKGEDIAKRVGIKKRTLYDRIHIIHHAMLGHLQDVICGC
jgi:hypothetical protein